MAILVTSNIKSETSTISKLTEGDCFYFERVDIGDILYPKDKKIVISNNVEQQMICYVDMDGDISLDSYSIGDVISKETISNELRIEVIQLSDIINI